MTTGPRTHIDDSYLFGMRCAICDEDTLAINHVDTRVLTLSYRETAPPPSS